MTFVGMPGSGKSTAVEKLTEHGYPVVYFGGIVLEELKERGLEVNEQNEREVREGLRKEFGKAALAKLVIKKIHALRSQGETNIAVDGLYSWSEYKALMEEFGNEVVLIAIVAKRQDRYSRLAQRPVRPLTPFETQTRDISEIENLEKGGPIAFADYYILNNGTFDDYYHSLNQILEDMALPSV